jgi:hypothetical protein
MYDLRRMGLPLGGLEVSSDAAAGRIAGALTGEVTEP